MSPVSFMPLSADSIVIRYNSSKEQPLIYLERLIQNVHSSIRQRGYLDVSERPNSLCILFDRIPVRSDPAFNRNLGGSLLPSRAVYLNHEH